jgi:hypothetical protein
MAEFPDSVGLGAGTSSMLENGDAVGLPGYALGRFTCAFCDDLKTYVESVHSKDIFKFLCGECGLKAQGPRHLREHIRNTHVGSAATATLAFIDLEQDLEGCRRMENVTGLGCLDAQEKPGLAGLEVVSLEVLINRMLRIWIWRLSAWMLRVYRTWMVQAGGDPE